MTDGKAELGEVQRFAGDGRYGILTPAGRAAKPADADALFLPQGGAILRAGAPALGTAGFDKDKVKLLGTSQWNEAANSEAPSLYGAWFAAPDPRDDARFADKYRGAFGSNPPQLAALAYDAVSLVAALASKGDPYKRFTRAALADPNGFSGRRRHLPLQRRTARRSAGWRSCRSARTASMWWTRLRRRS